MTIEKPVIIVGAGRSGSTAFHRAFSRHSQLAWLSALCGRYPRKPQLNRLLMQALDTPVIGPFAQQQFNPWESYGFWEQHCKGFSSPCRDLVASDVTNRARQNVHEVLSQMLTPQRRRLLIKVTGWSRIGFLQEIFPDAQFIHIVRDGRAVVNSTLEVPWWEGWGGPQGWRVGELTNEQRQEWEVHDKSFVALAGLEWKILMDAVEQARAGVAAENYLQVNTRICAPSRCRFFKPSPPFAASTGPRRSRRRFAIIL